MSRQSCRLLLRTTVAVVVLLAGVPGASNASVATSSPGWRVISTAVPTNFSVGLNPENAGLINSYHVVATNVGAEATNGSAVTITDELPAGLEVTTVNGVEYTHAFDHVVSGGEPTLDCTSTPSTATCTTTEVVSPGGTLEMYVAVRVLAAAPSNVMNTAGIAGGGASGVTTHEGTQITSTTAPYGVQDFSFGITNLEGATDTQAADHPNEVNVDYHLTTKGAPGHQTLRGFGPDKTFYPSEDPRDFVVDLPPGLVGNPEVVAKCPLWKVAAKECPASTQIGVAKIDIVFNENRTFNEVVEPIYNVVPEAGEPAQFQFSVDTIPTALHATVSRDTNYAVRVSVVGVPRIAELTGVEVTFFGSPASNRNIYNHVVGAQPLAFLENPVNCSAGPLTSRLSTDSWQHPGAWLPDGAPDLSDPNWKTATSVVYPSLTGCDMLQFEPSVSVVPDATRADEPTGVTVNVHVPQATDQFPALGTPELKSAVVTLPAGMSVSPSAADGLQACTNEEIALASPEPATCPTGSVLGTVKISTPLLPGPLAGQVFLGSPECDPCTSVDAADGRQLRIYIEAQGMGVRIKKEGRVYANPSTGQLTTRFEENPQLPFEDLELHFKGGLRAGLATPQACGAAATTADFTPWSTPVTPDANPTSSFNVDWDGNGGGCPGSLPLAPGFSAGTSNPNAGQFSPLTLTFSREDREQDLSGIQVHTPPGLLGTLTGVPLCGEPQAQQGTCGAVSRIGSMTVAAGAGPHPFYEKGALYLTGPYKGAPFGLSIVVPTVAGPFNLGNVVVRAAINVDPSTTALTVTSDPLPQIIDGIPLRLRSANVTIDRPGFIFNPTSCAQQQITATISGAQGATANVSAPFAVAGCAGLHFGPKFTVSTSGDTSRANGASLDAKVVYPPGAQSNIAKVKVDLPKQLPSRLTTLQKACPDATFASNPASCPAASVVGIARALTPVLPVTLTGPVYFVSHGGAAFPDLIVVLQGYGVRVDLTAATFISKKGITSSTFKSIPDVPVSSFELYLPEGKYSALAANGNLCTSSLAMPTSFIAQDGAQLKQNTKIAVTGCAKAKPKKKARKARSRRARKAAHRHAEHGRSK